MQLESDEEHERADHLSEDNGTYIIENLSNLERLDDPEMTRLKCRALAEL